MGDDRGSVLGRGAGVGAVVAGLLGDLGDLMLPRECAGCGRPGVGWCAACAACVRAGPVRVRPRVDPGVPVWSTGAFVGARRGAIIAVKERGRRDLCAPLGAAVARTAAALRDAGELDPPELSDLLMVPAPTRRSAARRRGGDPVARFTAAAAARVPGAACARMLRLRRGVQDSVGLGVADRERNLAGKITADRRADRARPPAGRGGAAGEERGRPTVVFVDDVLTTGTTAAESVRALAAAGVRVHAAIVVAHA